MPDHIKKEIVKLRAEIDALLSLVPVAQRAVLRPVLNRMLSILSAITEEL